MRWSDVGKENGGECKEFSKIVSHRCREASFISLNSHSH